MSKPVVARFAPSPTGFLHLGNIRTALLNWLFVRKEGGIFLLRLDDTDLVRSEDRFVNALAEDLLWFGLTHDGFIRQSDRTDLYGQHCERLKSLGRLYACYETPEELNTKRKLQLSQRRPPLYDREGLSLTDPDHRRLQAEGRKPHWRFRLEDQLIAWDDLIRGPIQYEGKVLGDPIVIREDGNVSFLLAGAIDDLDLGITHILRGEDHITNTAIQIQMIQALGGDPSAFHFGHFSLITDAQGQGFSKRLGSLSLGELRAQGMMPLTIASGLAALGTPDGPQIVPDLLALARTFDLGKLGRATPKLDVADLWALNGKMLHDMPYETALPLLRGDFLDLSIVTPEFWEAVRGELTSLHDLPEWIDLCTGSHLFPSPSEHAPLLEAALQGLPQEPWNGSTWDTWTRSLKEETGLSGRALYHPLRFALTGKDKGPEMRKLLPLIGYDRVRERLQASLAS
jgi:glutamyl-tRNA synthetase